MQPITQELHQIPTRPSCGYPPLPRPHIPFTTTYVERQGICEPFPDIAYRLEILYPMFHSRVVIYLVQVIPVRKVNMLVDI